MEVLILVDSLQLLKNTYSSFQGPFSGVTHLHIERKKRAMAMYNNNIRKYTLLPCHRVYYLANKC